MIRYNTYYRQDGRWKARISVGNKENGKSKYRSFYDKTNCVNNP